MMKVELELNITRSKVPMHTNSKALLLRISDPLFQINDFNLQVPLITSRDEIERILHDWTVVELLLISEEIPINLLVN